MKVTPFTPARAALAASLAALVLCCGAPLMAQGSDVVDEGTKSERPEGKRQHRIPQEVVEKYDKDGDGKLSEDERSALRDDRKKRILEKYDTNKDGELDDAEKAKFREERGDRRQGSGGKRQMNPEMLKQFDKDGDGELSAEERSALRDERKKRFMEKFDTNKDGELDEAEKASIKRMHGDRKGPRARGDKQPSEDSEE